MPLRAIIWVRFDQRADYDANLGKVTPINYLNQGKVYARAQRDAMQSIVQYVGTL